MKINNRYHTPEIKTRSVVFVANSAWNLKHFRLSLINIYIKKGYKVYLVGKSDNNLKGFPSRIQFINVDFMQNLYNPFFQLKIIWKLREIFKKNKISLIFTFTPQANILSGIAIRLFCKNAAFVPNISGLGSGYINRPFFSKFLMQLYKFALKNAHHIFFQNHEDRDLFKKLHISDVSNSTILPGSGIDLTKFKPKPISTLNSKRITFLFLGRLIKSKGIQEFILASEKVHQIYPRIQFDILGNFSNNKYEFNRKDLDSALRKNKQLKYKGFKLSTKKNIYESDCVVLPSYREGRPRALIEALACGRPIITSDAPGCREVVINNKTGYLVKVANTDDLFEKMIKFIQLPANDKITLGKNAATYAKKTFDIKFINQAYSKL